MPYHYAFQDFKENMARAVGTRLRISTKQSVEISKYIKGRSVTSAKALLQEVIKMKRAIPFTRFNRDMGHKPGKIAAGRYPIKASAEFLQLINSVEHNARSKGLNTTNLIIRHAMAQKAGNVPHYGRQGRRNMKYTHVEIVVEEGKADKK